ncbi:MAG: hypothetical protein ABI702_16460 [Burkholderiales bacterium]
MDTITVKPKVTYVQLKELIELHDLQAANELRIKDADNEPLSPMAGFAHEVATLTKQYIAKRLAPIELRLRALETRIEILETNHDD